MSLQQPTLGDFSALINAVLRAEVFGPTRELSDPDRKAEADAVRSELSLDPDGCLAWHPGETVTSVDFNDDICRYLDDSREVAAPAYQSERDETDYLLAGYVGTVAVSSTLTHAEDDDQSAVESSSSAF